MSLFILVVFLSSVVVTFPNVRGATNFNGTVESEYSDPMSGVTIILADCYFNILDTTTTNGQGDYSFSVNLNGNSPYYLTATKNYRWDTDMEIVYSGGTYDFELDAVTEKIAVFFWASNACNNDEIIDGYIDILEDEGYTKFYEFKDSSNVVSACQTVDSYERDVDTIFVYIFGHGLNSGSHSYTNFSISGSTVYSNDFQDYMDAWESPRKCLLVESCYSGDWADDFNANPYLAMSTSDENHVSKYYTTYEEGKFSHWFFVRVDAGYSAANSFTYAAGICTTQYPKKKDNSAYTWFN